MAPRTMALLGTVALLATLHLAAAHYNLKDPMPYNPIDCNRPGCKGPCPPVWKRGSARARNSPSNPSRVWRRGQEVEIEWHRNNHEGGFYRRSLVPVKYMDDKNWHKKTAFEFGCWTQGRYKCGFQRSCGTDKKGFAYRNTMTVPKVFPDGDYVFAMVWYGGLHWRRQKALFSDYYTCAFVRIQGGDLEDRHDPTFVPGRNHRSEVPEGKCTSTSSFVGECGGEECSRNRPTNDVPGEFRNGRRPKPVFLRELNGRAGDDRNVRVAPASEEKKAIEENKQEARKDDQMAREEENAKKEEQKELTNKKWVWKNDNNNNSWKKKNNDRNDNKWKKKNNDNNNNNNGSWKKKNNGNNNNNNGSWKKKDKWNKWKRPGCGYMPPAPVGSWGRRKSGLWWRQRAKWWKHYNYCRKCGC